MKFESFQDMQILHEVARSPRATQRSLGKRIGAALGLTHTRIKRLCAKGFIHQSQDGQKNRVRYWVTREGILEKNRLVAEYLHDCLRYYSRLRRFLKTHLSALKEQGLSRILLIGTGEIAEVAYLTLQEEGLELAGVIGEPSGPKTFFHQPVRLFEEIALLSFDRVLVATLQAPGEIVQRLMTAGFAPGQILQVPDDQALFPDPNRPEESRLPGFLSTETHTAVLSSLRPHGGNGSASGVGAAAEGGREPQLPLKPENTDVLILCGGRGSRLGSLTTKIPKPLLSVEGTPFLLRLIRRLQREGFRRFVLAGHYLPDRFRAFLSHYKSQLPDVELRIEPEPLGTGGALRYGAARIRSRHFLVLNGDSWVEQPFAPVLKDHADFGREFTVVAVQAARIEGSAFHKGVWQLGSEREVLGFDTREAVSEGWVNAGCYVVDRAMVNLWPNGAYSLEANLPILLTGRKAGVFCSPGRLLDIGTEDNYRQAGAILHVLRPAAEEVPQG